MNIDGGSRTTHSSPRRGFPGLPRSFQDAGLAAARRLQELGDSPQLGYLLSKKALRRIGDCPHFRATGAIVWTARRTIATGLGVASAAAAYAGTLALADNRGSLWLLDGAALATAPVLTSSSVALPD